MFAKICYILEQLQLKFQHQQTFMNQHISNDRLISHHRSREDYQQSPTNSLTFAYGDHRYVKFTYELLNQHDILKLKILKQLIQDFSLCQSIDLAIKSSDILSVLLKHLANSQDQIRLLSMTTIKKICASCLGRRTIILKDCILQIQKLINDKISDIRQNCYDALIEFAELTDGIQCLLSKNSILTDLVDKLVQEKNPQILNRAIILLRNLMQGQEGTPKALKTEIISRLMNILASSNSQIQTNILQTLANISFNYDGKQQIILKNHIKQLCRYVDHKTQSVRQAACLLLCSLSQLNEGKIQILNYCQFSLIVERLNDDPATVLNAIQLIANLAENPLGREKSLAVITKIENVKNIQKKYVDATLQVIRWKP